MKFTKITKISGEIVIKNDKGYIIYQKDSNGREYKWEYKYNSKGDAVYKKDPNGTEYKEEQLSEYQVGLAIGVLIGAIGIKTLEYLFEYLVNN